MSVLIFAKRIVKINNDVSDLPGCGVAALRLHLIPRFADVGRQFRKKPLLTCLHFLPGGKVLAPPVTHDSALLIVSGKVDVLLDAGDRASLIGGMGVVIKSRQHHSLHSPTGAVAIAVESGRLQATQEAISTPERIMGQRWPGER